MMQVYYSNAIPVTYVRFIYGREAPAFHDFHTRLSVGISYKPPAPLPHPHSNFRDKTIMYNIENIFFMSVLGINPILLFRLHAKCKTILIICQSTVFNLLYRI